MLISTRYKNKDNSKERINLLLNNLKEGNLAEIEKFIQNINLKNDLKHPLFKQELIFKHISEIKLFEDKNQIFNSLIQTFEESIQMHTNMPGQSNYVDNLKIFKNKVGYHKALNFYDQANNVFLEFYQKSVTDFYINKSLYQQSLEFYEIAEKTCIAHFLLNSETEIQNLLDKIKTTVEFNKQTFQNLLKELPVDENLSDPEENAPTALNKDLELNLAPNNIENDSDNLPSSTNSNDEVNVKAFNKFIEELNVLRIGESDSEKPEKDTPKEELTPSISDVLNQSIQEMQKSISKTSKGDKAQELGVGYSNVSSPSNKEEEESVPLEKIDTLLQIIDLLQTIYLQEESTEEEMVDMWFYKGNDISTGPSRYSPISQNSEDSEIKKVNNSVLENESSDETMSIKGLFSGMSGSDSDVSAEDSFEDQDQKITKLNEKKPEDSTTQLLQNSSHEEEPGDLAYSDVNREAELKDEITTPESPQLLSSGEESNFNLLNQSSGGTSMKSGENQQPSFQQDIEELTSLLTQKDLNHTEIKNILFRVDILLLSRENSLSKSLDSLTDSLLKEQIFETLITKIDGALSKISDIGEEFYLNKLRITSLGKQAEAIEEQYNKESEPAIKLDKFKQVIKLYDEANIMCNKFLNTDTKDNPEKKFQDKVFSIISDYSSENPDHAYILANQSLEARSVHLTTGSSEQISTIEAFYPSLLLAMISLPYVANKTDDEALKLKALEESESAYSMCHLHGANLEYLTQILKNMANLNRYFGDDLKATVQDKQATAIENKQEEYANIYAKSNIHSPIISSGITTQAMIAVKRAIQESVLDKVSEAAANGKWQEKNYMGVDYGAGGYLAEPHIKSCLGEELAGKENADANLKIALMLAFETMNLGIMNSEAKNPTCAMHFAIKNPDLIKEIIKNHPDFFVSSHIFRSVIKDAHSYAQDLFGYQVDQNGEYNKFFEKVITPFVEHRLKDTVFTPIYNLVKSDVWSDSIKNKMLGYIDDNYLTSSLVGNSHLGSNLGGLPDVLNIVRILAFKTINDALKDKGEPNYSPINAFAQKYLNIVERIVNEASDQKAPLKKDHFANNDVIKICNTKLSHAKKIEAIKNIEHKEFTGDVKEKGEDSNKPAEYKDLTSSDLFQSVLNFADTGHNTETTDQVTPLGETSI